MKISKIYSNKQDFKSIIFDTDGINFILSTDHSVGKSTLFELIDFCLLKGNKGFLDNEKFEDFIFYLELKLQNNSFLTIIRAVNSTKVSIKLTERSEMLLDTTQYDITDTVGKGKIFIESHIGLCLSDYRQYITYFLRDQDNQSDIFRLNKFLRQKDIYYKPLVSNLLGIDGNKIKRKFQLDNEIIEIEKELQLKEQDLGNYKTKESILVEIAVYEKQLSEKEELYKNFDFYLAEKNISKELVNEIEEEVSLLNQRRNSLKREVEYIDKS